MRFMKRLAKGASAQLSTNPKALYEFIKPRLYKKDGKEHVLVVSSGINTFGKMDNARYEVMPTQNFNGLLDNMRNDGYIITHFKIIPTMICGRQGTSNVFYTRFYGVIQYK